MTDTEINVAIAEACGYKFFCVNVFNERVYHGPNGEVAILDHNNERDRLGRDSFPDYVNDLNAMQEVWLTLTESEDRIQFSCALAEIVARRWGIEPEDGTLVLEGLIENATARQRAEAFLRTVGRWKEAP